MSKTSAIALVIGGSRGIGAAIVRKLAALEFEVFFTYQTNAEIASGIVADIVGDGGRATALRCDLSSMSDLEHIMARLDQEAGELRVLVNNGAIWALDPLASLDEASFDRTMDVNLKGPLFLARLAAPRLRDGGRIIMISSIAARIASPDYLVYAASKAGLNAVVRGLAMLLGPHGTTVNAISPGLTETDMFARMSENAPAEAIQGTIAATALGRLGLPRDIAGAVGLLAHADSGWITGQIIECAGGLFL